MNRYRKRLHQGLPGVLLALGAAALATLLSACDDGMPEMTSSRPISVRNHVFTAQLDLALPPAPVPPGQM